MRNLITIAGAMLFASPALAGTLTVQNETTASVTQNNATGAFAGIASTILAAGQASVTANFPPSVPQRANFGNVQYRNNAGQGCSFEVSAIAGSGVDYITAPRARSINGGVCSVARGATNSDFIYIIK